MPTVRDQCQTLLARHCKVTNKSNVHHQLPSRHNEKHYDNISNFNTKSGKAVIDTGQMTKGTRRASPHHFSHEATDATWLGILQALSEDNSECLPLDDDEGLRYLNISNDNGGGKLVSKRSATDKNRGRFFHSKPDMMLQEGNSLMALVLNEKQSYFEAGEIVLCTLSTGILNPLRLNMTQSFDGELWS